MGMPLAVILGRLRQSPAMSEVGWATSLPMLRAMLLLSRLYSYGNHEKIEGSENGWDYVECRGEYDFSFSFNFSRCSKPRRSFSALGLCLVTRTASWWWS